MPRARLLGAQLLAFIVALGAFAVTATACEGGGGGGKELTSLSTSLSGEGKEGEAITVAEGTKVKDKATLNGKNASKATGTVTYKVYSEKECKTLVTSAGEVTVSGESVPASSEEELEGGKAYYWQAHYGGDTNNDESTSPCTEVLDIQAKTALSTKLSGEGKEAEELIVSEGSKVKDKATLSGTNSSSAGGKLLYKIYSDKECKSLVKEAGEVTVTSGSVPASSEVELSAGTYYWQATYKGDSLHKESTSACGVEIARVHPPAPTVEEVDFKNNKEVYIDHQNDATGESALAIDEVGAKNSVEWQTSTIAGDTKNWPVAFVRGTKPKLVAQFALKKPTEEFIAKKLEGNVTVIGEYTVGGAALKLETEVTKAELEAHKGFFETPEFEAKNTALPNKVLYGNSTITWKWKLKEAGQPAFEQGLGDTSHNFYLTFAAPLAGAKTYLTLLDLATKGIEKENQPPTEAEAINGIWSEFKTLSIGLRWYEIEPGTLHRGGQILDYYEQHETVGETLEQVDEADGDECKIAEVAGLLEEAKGQCGAWAKAFAFALANEGISSVVLNVQAKFGAVGEKCEALGACNMLINNWKFEGAGGSGVPKFPWAADEIKDVAGLAGQGIANPPAVFGNHIVVEAKKGGKTLYDPSYGTGPFAGAEPLNELQQKDVAGFCGPIKAHKTECQKTPAVSQLASKELQKFE
jgi:hypothetical protein